MRISETPASGTSDRLTNTDVNRALSEASLMSDARAMPSPAPADTPLIAAMIGCGISRRWGARRMVIEGPGSGLSGSRSPPLAILAGISPTSAPEQKPRPAPVMMTARISGNSPANWSRASCNSWAIWRFRAFNRSGRCRVITATWSRRCRSINSKLMVVPMFVVVSVVAMGFSAGVV